MVKAVIYGVRKGDQDLHKAVLRAAIILLNLDQIDKSNITITFESLKALPTGEYGVHITIPKSHTGVPRNIELRLRKILATYTLIEVEIES